MDKNLILATSFGFKLNSNLKERGKEERRNGGGRGVSLSMR